MFDIFDMTSFIKLKTVYCSLFLIICEFYSPMLVVSQVVDCFSRCGPFKYFAVLYTVVDGVILVPTKTLNTFSPTNS